MPNTYASGSGLGYQSGGFAPTPAEAISSELRARSSQGLMEHALYSDPRTRALAGMAASALAGDPATAAKLISNTKTGQFIKDSIGMAMHAGLVPGGNPMQMAHGVQQMVASQGFRMGGNLGGGGQLFGAGFVTDQISRSVFDNVRNSFFDRVSGLGKRNTFGMDMSQMGDAMGYLSARGTFAGQRLGDLNKFNDVKAVKDEIARAQREGGQGDYVKELQALEKKGTGGIAFKIDKNQLKKVNEIFTDYAATLKDAREVFGNLPINELTQAAERLIGTSISEFGAMPAMRNRMATIRATSDAFGLNPEALARNIMNSADSIQNQLYQKGMQDPRMNNAYQQAAAGSAYGRMATSMATSAAITGVAGAASSREYANEAARNGRYVREFDEQQISAALGGGMATIIDEKQTGMKTALVARNLLSRGKIKGATADQVNQLLSRLESNGDQEDITDINSEISAVLSRAGIDSFTIEQNKTTADLLGGMDLTHTEKHKKMLQKNLRARSINSLIDIHEEGTDEGMLGSRSNREGFMKLATTLDTEGRKAIMGAIRADGSIDEGKLEEAFANTAGLADAISKGEVRDIITGLRDDPSRKKGNLKDQIGGLIDDFRSDPVNMDLVDDMTQNKARERSVHSYLSKISLGGPMSKEDFGTELVRGFFGTGKVSDQMIMEKLKNEGSKRVSDFKLNSDKTGLDMVASDIADLGGQIGGENLIKLYRDLGIEVGDKTGLAAALGTHDGFQALQANMGKAMGAVTKDGFSIVDGDTVEETQTELEDAAMMTHARRLLGEGNVPEMDLSSEKGRAAYNDSMREGLTADGNKRLTELSENAKKAGYGGSDFETLANQYKRDPALGNLLKKEESELRDKGLKGDDKAMGKANDLRALRNQLEGESGGNKFLGILEIASDSIAQLKLFKQ